MARRLKHGIRGAPFDNLAGVEDQDAIGETGKQGGIMGNENHGEAEIFPERTKDAENFHLGDWVKRCGRFIGDDDCGITGDGLGDEGALPLAAAELVGIGTRDAVCVFRKEPAENFAGALGQLFFWGGLVRGQHLANLLADADGGMESERRLLKNQGDSAAANLPQFLIAGLEKIFAFEQYGAASDVAVRRKKPQD